MTIEQERDIAVAALEDISRTEVRNHGGGRSSAGVMRQTSLDALAAIKREQTLQALVDEAQGHGEYAPAIAAQAAPVVDGQSELAMFQYWAACQTEPLAPIAAWKAGRSSVAVPSMPEQQKHEFTATYESASNESLHIIEVNECNAPLSLTTIRFQAAFKEIHRLQFLLASQPAAQPVGEAVAYVRASELAKLADNRVAGIGMMLSKEPTDGRIALYTAPPVAQDQSAANDITEKFKTKYDRVAALREQDQDAARYRWLREKRDIPHGARNIPWTVALDPAEKIHTMVARTGIELDFAIDAAMQAEVKS